MAIIQITPEVLEAKASEVRSLKSQHDEIITKMKSIIEGLNDTWKGEAQSAFASKFESMKGTFTSFSEMLEGYAKLMDTSAKEMRGTDQNLKSSIQNFG